MGDGDHFGDEFSLVDLGKLNPSIIKLISATEKAIGGIFKPMQIRRVAKAKADALLIVAEADVKKQEIAYRASQRIVFLEVKRQENVENIIKEAIKVIPHNTSEEPVDPDWIAFFFDECKDVGNDEVQKIWGNLLAGEFVTPGSFSRKAISILKTMSSIDSKRFENLCSMIFIIENELGIIASLDSLPRFLCFQMEPLGLVMTGFDVLEADNLREVYFWGKKYSIVFSRPNPNTHMVAIKRFTPAGIELARLARKPHEEVINNLNKEYKNDSIQIIES
jgi:hypothetical protein